MPPLEDGCPLRIKICGITTIEDAVAAAAAGADAIGLNFVGGPRELDLARAREILPHVPALVTPVALVRLEQGRLSDALVELLGEFWVSYLQVYGALTRAALADLRREGFRPMPVVAVKEASFASGAAEWLSEVPDERAAAVVLDAFDPGRAGGTGRVFPWDWVIAARRTGGLAGWPPIILAGGLRPENVAEAVRTVAPYAVDVSSGVELDGMPGRKDRAKMEAFVRAARAASADT